MKNKAKKKATILTSLIMALTPLLGRSQNNDTLKCKRLIITVSVFEYFPGIKLNTGNINVGTEVYLKNRMSLWGNIGLIASYGPSKGWLSISSQNTLGVRVQTEVRRYFGKHKIFEPAILLFWPHIFQYKTQLLQNTGYYVSLHSIYQRTVTEREEVVVDYIANNPFPNTVYNKKNVYLVNREVFGLNIKLGYQCIKNAGLTVDFGIGIGVQYISSVSKNKLGDDSAKDYPWNKLFDTGQGFYPNLSYQLKIGWAL